MRGRNSIFTTVLERERVEEEEEEREEGGILATAQDIQTYRVLSIYSVHRINPQCVLTNITQLPPDWFMCVCRREARSAPGSTPPLGSPPTGTETAAPTRRRSVIFSRADTHSHAIKQQTVYKVNGGALVRACSRDLMLSSEAGTGERRCCSHTIKFKVFG